MKSDKTLIKRRFEAQFSRYDRLALVQQQICEQLSDVVARVCEGKPESALEVGAGTGFLTRQLIQHFPDTLWYINDITDASQQYVDKYITSIKSDYIWGDAESISLPTKLNLVASASTVQWFDNLPLFIEKCALNTLSGGYLALTTFGQQNFIQIKTLTGEGLNYYSAEELFAMLNKYGYHIEESLEYIKDLSFDTPIEVIKHIKHTGVNSLKPIHWTKQSLAKFEHNYHLLCPMGITLTYHPIIIVAKLK